MSGNADENRSRLADLDAGSVSTSDINEEKALQIVQQLLKKGVVEMDDQTPILVHTPTGRFFESSVNLAHFHKGWEEGQSAE